MKKIGEKDTKYGVFEFFLNEEEDQVKLVCAHGDKTAEATYCGKIQGRNTMKIECLDVRQNGKTMMFIGLPDEVYNAFQNAKSKFALKNIHLTYAGRSAETGIKFYRLSAEIPRDVWRKISKYFEKFYRDEEDALDGELIGWLTAQPEVVEKILNVREELTLEYRRREAEKRREEKKKKANELQAKIDGVKKAFENAEYPNPGNKMRVEGEVIQHPTHPENVYGGGEWWVIQESWIWYVRNNGFDGDDWGRNNVQTGGAGAIGVRVPFSEELAAQIRSLKK
jgi:hypothetical protein